MGSTFLIRAGTRLSAGGDLCFLALSWLCRRSPQLFWGAGRPQALHLNTSAPPHLSSSLCGLQDGLSSLTPAACPQPAPQTSLSPASPTPPNSPPLLTEVFSEQSSEGIGWWDQPPSGSASPILGAFCRPAGCFLPTRKLTELEE